MAKVINFMDNGVGKSGLLLTSKECSLFKETTALVVDSETSNVIHVVKTNTFKNILECIKSHIITNQKDYLILKAQYSF